MTENTVFDIAPIKYSESGLAVLDQTRLPGEEIYIKIENKEDIWAVSYTHLNIAIAQKEVTAFIGPSGCGKSTLLKTFNRMNDLIESCRIDGKVYIDGQDIYEDIDVTMLRKRVGMVFQRPNPFPMSVYDNVAYGPRTHGIRTKAALDDIVERSLSCLLYTYRCV